MVVKLLIFVFFVSLTVLTIVEAEDDWSCEIFHGTPCSAGNSVMMRDIGREEPHINVSMDATCTDRNKQESSTFIGSETEVNMRNATMEVVCLGDSTPCITDFYLCITDFHIPPVTLKCRYLEDFEQTETEIASSGNQTSKCGTKAAKDNTYFMTTTRGTTTITYNSERLHIAKPKARYETHPTTPDSFTS